MNRSNPNVGQASTLRSDATEDGSRLPGERVSASRIEGSGILTQCLGLSSSRKLGESKRSLSPQPSPPGAERVPDFFRWTPEARFLSQIFLAGHGSREIALQA